MASAEHAVVFGAGVDSDFGLFPGQSQRLFTENVLPRGNSTLDLLGVKRMRRGKNDGLHTGVLEGLDFTAVVLEAVGFGKFLPRSIGLRGANDLYVALCLLQHRGHFLAPPAEADHRDFDGSALIHLKISTIRSRPGHMASRLLIPQMRFLCPAKASRGYTNMLAGHTAPVRETLIRVRPSRK